MKLYAIIEIDDDMYDDFKEWYITGDDLDIRYVDENSFIHYKGVKDDYSLQLKPLPQKKENKIVLKGNLKEELKVYQCGWNDCLNEILGEE